MTTRFSSWAVLTLVAWFAATPSAHAHLLPAGHGTLNFVDDGAYLVLSMPTDAFSFADTNRDGTLTSGEFAKHREKITAQVLRSVVLRDRRGASLPLEGLMLSLSTHNHDGSAAAGHILALGRFAVDEEHDRFSLQIDLGRSAVDDAGFRMRVRRRADIVNAVLLPGTPGHWSFEPVTSL